MFFGKSPGDAQDLNSGRRSPVVNNHSVHAQFYLVVRAGGRVMAGSRLARVARGCRS